MAEFKNCRVLGFCPWKKAGLESAQILMIGCF